MYCSENSLGTARRAPTKTFILHGAPCKRARGIANNTFGFMAKSSLVKKLLIKTGYRLALINPPHGYREELGELPDGAQVVNKVDSSVDFVQIFVRNSLEFEKFVQPAIRTLKSDNLLWICYPKGSSKIETDLNRDVLWEKMKKLSFAGVAMVSVNDTWSAMRFRPSGKAGK